MTHRLVKFAAPAALVIASFAAHAGEGPIEVRHATASSQQAAQPAAAAPSAAQSVQGASAKQPASTTWINVGA
ncbi:MAG: hypothetical protein WCK28_21910 [Burkholderiales bacterium]|jgi:hypothetical protein